MKRPREEEEGRKVLDGEREKSKTERQAASCDGVDVDDASAAPRPSRPPPPPPPPSVVPPPRPQAPPSIPGLELPTGWLLCPRMGRNFKSLPGLGDAVAGGFNVVPSKAPLGRRFVTGGAVPPDDSFTPSDISEDFSSKGMRLGLVLDLTNTGRYYDPAEWGSRGVAHQKIYCPPRGQVPHPSSVNHFCYEMLRFSASSPGDFVLVHCTHGYNRTGFMLVSWMVRCGGMAVADAVEAFARARPPGIYKDDYLDELFRYNHERRPPDLRCPPVPEFKASEPDSPRRDGDEGAAADDDAGGGDGVGGDRATDLSHLTPVGAQVPEGVDHDAPFGEAIHPEEEDDLRRTVFELVSGRRTREHELPHFPGSQPVSLARENVPELSRQRYSVTWKADGTRYLALIMPWGCYFVDRALGVQWVQARFPTRCTSKQAAAAAAAAASGGGVGGTAAARPPKDFRPPLLGPPHFQTILDGEMVVDEDLSTGARTRRFLVYDAVVVGGKSLVDLPFKARYEAIEREVVAPRSRERDAIEAVRAAERARDAERVKAAASASASGKKVGGLPPAPPLDLPPHLRGGGLAGARLSYDYAGELFRLRRKEFWPLAASRNLLEKFIPRLSHESDGLILQPSEARYVTGTFPMLLKWKFAHMNSVDFKLKIDLAGDKTLYLLETRRDRPRRGEVPLVPGMASSSSSGAGGAGSKSASSSSSVAACTRVDLAAVADERALSGKIIECAWDPGKKAWVFMRVRADKDTPNAVSTYEKVVQSIEDDITEDVLLKEVDAAAAALEERAARASKGKGDEATPASGVAGGATSSTAAAAPPPSDGKRGKAPT